LTDIDGACRLRTHTREVLFPTFLLQEREALSVRRRLLLGALVVLFAFMAVSAAFAAPKVIKIGHTGTKDHHYQMYLETWAEKVSAATDNRYTFEIYPSDLYGKPNQLIEGAQLGTTDMVLATGSLLTSYNPKIGVLSLPFIFKDSQEAHDILNGPVGKEFEEGLAKRNLIILGWW